VAPFSCLARSSFFPYSTPFRSRSSLRSFSLWARHSAETSAELNVRSVRRNFSPWPAGRCEGEEAAEGRKCEGGAGNGSGSRVVGCTEQTSERQAEPASVGRQIS